MVKIFADLAKENGFPIEEFDNHMYAIHFPLQFEDEIKTQTIYFRDWFDDHFDRQTYYINTYLCDISSKIDPYLILREADFGRLTILCIKKMTLEDGSHKEGLYIQSSIPVHFIQENYEEFMKVIFEVAANADYVLKLISAENQN
jgi:hypothetical protein